jgi:hypothetical protein
MPAASSAGGMAAFLAQAEALAPHYRTGLLKPWSGCRSGDVNGVLCLGGLLGAIVGNMRRRHIGIVGYAVALPVQILRMCPLIAATPAGDDMA